MALDIVRAYPASMDDRDDTEVIITNAVEALRLAGISDETISEQLIVRGLVLRLLGGAKATDIPGEIEDILTDLAKHISKE